MALYRNVQISFWTDSKIDNDFTPDDRYFLLYLFTNPHTNLCGCYEISTRQMGYETGLTNDKVKNLLERITNIHRVALYDRESREILILNWHKYNWNNSPKFLTALRKEIEQVKCDDFRQYLTDILNGEDTVSIQNRYGIEAPVTDTDSDSAPKKSATFKPPTLEEVRAYCQERNNGVDADTFVNFYESKGWMVGKNKMKDWKSAVRTWEKNRNVKSNSASKPNQFQRFPQREISESDYADIERRKLGLI